MRCLRALLLVALVASLPAPARAAARRGLCATIAAGAPATAPRLAILSAFPAEIAPLVAAAEVTDTVTVDDKAYYLATLEGVRVILGFTGIGLVNAANRTRSVLKNFDVAGFIMTGVAGSPRRIADVTVPEVWELEGTRRTFRPNPAFLALARQSAGDAVLEKCTAYRGGDVCLPFDPAVFVGGLGHSSDPFMGMAVQCADIPDDIFGCALPPAPAVALAAAGAGEDEVAQAQDMETGAAVRVATQRHVPHIAYRAVSDGAGDPLGLPGFPAQFFAYYHLAVINAGGGVRAFLTRLAALGAGDAASRRVCRMLAQKRWRRAAALLERMP